MKMKRILYRSILALASVAIFSSCEKEVNLDLKSAEPHIVIEARVPADSLASVRITKTKDYDTDNNYPNIAGAIVKITDNTGNSEILQQNASGIYTSSILKGVVGRTYNMYIEVEDNIYTATSTMPKAVKMDSIIMYDFPAAKERFPMLIFNDPKGEENYYRHTLYINDVRIREIYVTSDEDRDGTEINRILPYQSENYNDHKIEKGDRVIIDTHFIDKPVYTFFEDWARISENVANPTSNIIGGALGYFSAYSHERTSVIADW